MKLSDLPYPAPILDRLRAAGRVTGQPPEEFVEIAEETLAVILAEGAAGQCKGCGG